MITSRFVLVRVGRRVMNACFRETKEHKPVLCVQKVSLKVDHVVREVTEALGRGESPVISLWETGAASTTQIFQENIGAKTLRECSALAVTLRRTIEHYADSMNSEFTSKSSNADSASDADGGKTLAHTKQSLLKQLEQLDLPPPPLDMVFCVLVCMRCDNLLSYIAKKGKQVIHDSTFTNRF